MLFIDIIEK